MKIRFIALLTLVLFISTGIGYLTQPVPMPNVTIKTITGKTIELTKLYGHPIIVSFWATNCPACIKEIPHLIKLYNEYHPQGLEIIAINMHYDRPNHVASTTKDKKIPYDVALDIKGELAHAFGSIMVTPTSYLISPQGQIVMKQNGMLNIPDIQQRLDEFLATPYKTAE